MRKPVGAIALLGLGCLLIGSSHACATEYSYVIIDPKHPPSAPTELIARVATKLKMKRSALADGGVALRSAVEGVLDTPGERESLPAADAAGREIAEAAAETPAIVGLIAELQAAETKPMPPFGTVIATGTCRKRNDDGWCSRCSMPIASIQGITQPGEPSTELPGAVVHDSKRCELRYDRPSSALGSSSEPPR